MIQSADEFRPEARPPSHATAECRSCVSIACTWVIPQRREASSSTTRIDRPAGRFHMKAGFRLERYLRVTLRPRRMPLPESAPVSGKNFQLSSTGQLPKSPAVQHPCQANERLVLLRREHRDRLIRTSNVTPRRPATILVFLASLGACPEAKRTERDIMAGAAE